MMLAWKMAACLAAGNTVVLKPAQVRILKGKLLNIPLLLLGVGRSIGAPMHRDIHLGDIDYAAFFLIFQNIRQKLVQRT